MATNLPPKKIASTPIVEKETQLTNAEDIFSIIPSWVLPPLKEETPQNLVSSNEKHSHFQQRHVPREVTATPPLVEAEMDVPCSDDVIEVVPSTVSLLDNMAVLQNVRPVKEHEALHQRQVKEQSQEVEKQPYIAKLERPRHKEQSLRRSSEFETAFNRSADETSSMDTSGKAHAQPPNQSRHGHNQVLKRPEALPQDKLLSLLMFRIHQDRKAQEARAANWKQAEKNLIAVQEENKNLAARMHDAQNTLITQQEEIVRHQNVKVVWKEKARKLESFLRGLTNDHHKFRDDTKGMRTTLENLVSESTAARNSIKDMKTDLYQCTTNIRNITIRDKEVVAELKANLEHQESQISDGTVLLDFERHRNDNLEADVKNIASQQRQIFQRLEDHQGALAARSHEDSINVIGLHQLTANKAIQIQSDINRMASMIEILGGQESLAKPDLDKIEYTIRNFAGNVTTAMEQSAKRVVAGQVVSAQKLQSLDGTLTSIANHLHSLGLSFQTEQAWMEKISSVRVSKARLEREIKEKDLHLENLRSEFSKLTEVAQAQKTEIVRLETINAVLRSRPEDPSLTSKLQDTETKNMRLEAELSSLQTRVEELQGMNSDLHTNNEAFTASSRHHDEIVRGKDDQLESLKAQLTEMENSVAILIEHKRTFKEKLKIQINEVKASLLKAANSERFTLEQNHATANQNFAREKRMLQQDVHRLEQDLKEAQVMCNEKVSLRHFQPMTPGLIRIDQGY